MKTKKQLIKDFIVAMFWFLLSTAGYVYLFSSDWKLGFAILAIHLSNHASLRTLLKDKAGIII